MAHRVSAGRRSFESHPKLFRRSDVTDLRDDSVFGSEGDLFLSFVVELNACFRADKRQRQQLAAVSRWLSVEA